MTDPIADMLTRLRNGQAIRQATVMMPHSKIKEAIAKTLKAEGYITNYEVVDGHPAKTLSITPKYVGQAPSMTVLKRISKPGRRLYGQASAMVSPLSGHGITIVSTSKGVMTGAQAKRQKVGGELLCQIW